MSLVAYDDSGSSDYEDDVETNTSVIQSAATPGSSKAKSPVDDESETESDGSLFNALPKPTHKVSEIIEEEDEFLYKKDTVVNHVKPKSKITVPSLNDFKDVADTVPQAKPKAANGKKSGLLSILPHPKNGSVSATQKSFIPHVLTKKADNVKKKELSKTLLKKPKTESQQLIKDYSDDSDNDDEVQNDFFSINKPLDYDDKLPLDTEQYAIEDVKPSTSKKEARSIESYFKKDVETPVVFEQSHLEQNDTEMAYSEENSAATHQITSSNEAVLDDEAILKLVGARGKRKMEEIQIVDFNQQEVLAEARQLLLKGLMEDTSKRVSASKKRGNEPTHMQKRKHQITYLAHQAKANEVELQNKWANNRMSKRQTQSKYGF